MIIEDICEVMVIIKKHYKSYDDYDDYKKHYKSYDDYYCG